jgi:superfamily II DNA or RNA helicase
MEKLEIRIDNMIRIRLQELPLSVADEIRKRLTFKNPRYFKQLRFNKSGKTDVSPELYCFRETEDDLVMTRGFMAELIRLLHRNRIQFGIDDHTRQPSQDSFVFIGGLYDYQASVFEAVVKKRFGIITGNLGSGKKVVTLKILSLWQVPALIVVNTRRQLYVWKDTIKRFTGLDDAEISLVGDGHKETSGKIIVAVNRSLYGLVDIIKERIGLVVVDLCNLVNLNVFFKIVKKLDAYYMLGLATSPKRQDRLTPLMFAYLGPVLYQIRSEDCFRALGTSRPVLYPRLTGFDFSYNDNYAEMIDALCGDNDRNQKIIADLLEVTSKPSRRALVISERKNHLQALQNMLGTAYKTAEIITGDTSEKQRNSIQGRFDRGKLQVVILTLKSIPGLSVEKTDSLFIACPLKIADHIAQLIGRILLKPGHTDIKPVIYDYFDQVDILKASYFKRRKLYRLMGAVEDRSRLYD